MTLLSFRQYAKHRGVSAEAVSKAVRSGRISTIPGPKPGQRLIDPDIADREWAANTEHGKRKKDFAAEMSGTPVELELTDEPPPELLDELPLPEEEPAPTRRMRSALDAAAAEEIAQELLERGGDDEDESPKTASFAKSRALREAYAARLAKLAYEEKAGKLIAVDTVKQEAFKTGRVIRDRMLNIADRLANELAADSDPRSVHRKLTEEIKQALGKLAEEL